MKTMIGEIPRQNQPMNPTPEEVRKFWDHMSSKYGTRVIKHSNSILMKAISLLLRRMRVPDVTEFLKNYAITLGKNIYVPFEIGVPYKNFDLMEQMICCVHEHTHVDQIRKIGKFKFYLRYAFNSAKRARFEADAYRANMEMHFWRFGTIRDVRKLAGILKNYGCSSSDRKYVENFLAISAETVSRGGVINRSSQTAIRWLNKHAPHLSRKE